MAVEREKEGHQQPHRIGKSINTNTQRSGKKRSLQSCPNAKLSTPHSNISGGTCIFSVPPSSNYHWQRPIGRVVSFDEGKTTTNKTAVAATRALHRPSIKTPPRKRNSILQKRLQQIQLEVESTQQAHPWDTQAPTLTDCAGNFKVYTKGDKPRRSCSICQQQMEMMILHHQKKGIDTHG